MTGEVIVKNLSKAYVKKRGLITRSCNDLSSSNLALDSISFTIKKGESFGIIGINGAGKSTLLKILSGVSIPTSGSVFTNGRVVSLLELGIGFHPEFTGRQNIYLISHLLGFKKNEIEYKNLKYAKEAFIFATQN